MNPSMRDRCVAATVAPPELLVHKEDQTRQTYCDTFTETAKMSRYLAAAAMLFGGLAGSALAHHGWGGYTRADFTLTGTVTDTHLGNPHDRLTVAVDGQMWNVVLSPPARSRRAGFDNSVIEVGDTVTLLGNRHADAGTLEMKTRRITVHDRDYDLYPSRL